jgi:hypothetical protein
LNTTFNTVFILIWNNGRDCRAFERFSHQNAHGWGRFKVGNDLKRFITVTVKVQPSTILDRLPWSFSALGTVKFYLKAFLEIFGHKKTIKCYRKRLST